MYSLLIFPLRESPFISFGGVGGSLTEIFEVESAAAQDAGRVLCGELSWVIMF